jgi:hypothetical protein
MFNMNSYFLSSDGSAVYRLVGVSSIPADSFNTSLLFGGYTAIFGNAGVLSAELYNAGFDIDPNGKIHNAQFEALYSYGQPLPLGDSLQWIQVITTNDQPGLTNVQFLDNLDGDTSQPFYSYTIENRWSNLPANELNFYDYSGRSPNDLVTVANPINWSAALYPVIINSNNKILTIENGLSWGFTEKSATVGTDTGVFVNPGPAGATVTGVGTNTFTWGSGEGITNGAPSSLSFSGGSFNATVNQPFDLGTVTYFNGSNTNDADEVILSISVDLTNVPEKDFTLSVPLALVNTPNTDDAIASADTVSFANFGSSLHVEEGDTATADVYATLSTGFTGSISGVSVNSLYSSDDTLGTNPSYNLNIVGFENVSAGGFVTTLNVQGTQSGQKVASGGTISPFASVSINDSETGLTETLTVTLSDATNGTLSNLGDGTYDGATGVYSATGTLADVTGDLDALVFTPTPDVVTPTQTLTTSFTITDTNSYGASATNTNTSVSLTAVLPTISVAITSPGGVTSQPVQMVSGTVDVADAGTVVTVFDGTAQIGTAKVQADGNWSAAVTLVGVAHTITASDTDVLGNTASSNAVNYTLSATAPATGILESLTPPDEIAAIYLGYFNRGPAPVGFSFWQGQYSQALANGQSRDQALQNIANSFTPQSETLALYPFLSTTTLNSNSPTDVSGVENLVENIFANLFDRAPANVGMQYWTQQLLSGAVPLGLAILDIANGAQSADANIVLNKVVVSDYFVAQDTAAGIGLTSPLPASLLPEAHAILLGVTPDPATVAAAENTIDAFAAGTASVITGTVNDDTLTGGSNGGDIIFTAGGADTINLSSTSHATETIYFGVTVSAAATAVVPITDASGVTQQGFWGNGPAATGLSASTSVDMSVVDDFTAGAAGDILGFDFMAWGSGGSVNGTGTELGLVQGDATTPVGVGSATLDSVAVAGATLAANANVVEDGVATYANATALASALSSDSGYLLLAGNGLAANDEAHMLVAYSTGSNVNIADVMLDNTTSAAQVDTANLTVTASDMAQLAGVSLTALTTHNISLVA